MAIALSSVAALARLAPLPLSDVQLTGDWAVRQSANREVLMSLNMSRWACHFTSTANLTSCSAMGTPWFTFMRNDSAASSFNAAQEGFLAAGDDVDPPKNETVAACKAACLAAASCKGITFQGETSNTTRVVKCYTKSAIHFTPSSKTGNCVVPGGTGQPSCAPLPGEMGLGGTPSGSRTRNHLRAAPPLPLPARRSTVRISLQVTTGTTRVTGCRRARS
jgi:hypothetical protein